LPSNANVTTWRLKDALIYMNGVVVSVGGWWLIVVGLQRLRSARPWAILALSTCAATVALSSFGYRMHAFQSPSWQLIRFLVVEPHHAVTLTTSEFRPTYAVVLAALVSVVFAALAYASARGVELPRWRAARALSVVTLVVSGVIACFVPGAQHPLPVDTNAVAAVAQLGVAWTTGERHLVAPIRPALAPSTKQGLPSILLLLHESMRADAVVPDLGYEGGLDARTISPWSSHLVERRSEGFVVMKKARSNSTATESSVPTILSGLDVGGESDAFGRAHSIWSLGKASGAETFLLASPTYHWSHFDEFFFDKNVDLQRTGGDFGPDVNDVGCDEVLPVDATIEHVKRLHAENKRFVGVVHFNATHYPGYAGPGVVPSRDPIARYAQAATYVDSLVERLWTTLDAAGVLEDTVVLSTSDHGEPYDSPHRVERLGSYYDETIRVPFWVRIPPRFATEHPEWSSALDTWAGRNVQNADLLPTVRDLLSLDEPSLRAPVLAGRSLVAPPAGDDTTTGQSTCAFRTWHVDGLFAVRGNTKVVLSNQRVMPEVFDLSVDPRESQNLWGTDEGARLTTPWLEPLIRAGQERMAVCQRVGSACPLGAQN
jgi:glucan phosphoethanolaminetransferase (alkaline phosphatase superfamily)